MTPSKRLARLPLILAALVLAAPLPAAQKSIPVSFPVAAGLDAVIVAPAAGLSALDARASDSASLLKDVLVHPQVLKDAGVRASLETVLGPGAAAKADLAAARLQQAAAADPALKGRLEREAAASLSPAAVGARLAVLRAAFEALGGRAPASLDASVAGDQALSGAKISVFLTPGQASPSALSAPLASAPAARPSLSPRRSGSAGGSWGRSVRAWAAAAALGLGVFAAQHPALAQDRPAIVAIDSAKSADYVRAADMDDVLRRWSPEKHLYVVGTIPGMDDSTLRSLEAALKGTHWTVILVDEASGYSFTDNQGGVHSGREAVEFAAGQALMNKAAFMGQVHPQTGDQDGAHLEVTFGTRSGKSGRGFYIQGGPAYKTRGIDVATLQSSVYQGIAVPKLQSGKSMDAITASINEADRLLKDKVDAEFTSADSVLAAAGRSVDALDAASSSFAKSHPEKSDLLKGVDISDLRSQLKKARKDYDAKNLGGATGKANAAKASADSSLSSLRAYEADYNAASAAISGAETSVAGLESRLGAFKSAHPSANGTLTQAETEKWRSGLKAASQLLALGQTAGPAKVAGDIQSLADKFSAAIDAYPGAASELSAVEAKIKAQSGRERSSAAAAELGRAKDEAAEARRLYENGDLEYPAKTAAAKADAAMAQAAIDSADSSAAARSAFFMFLAALSSLLTLGAGFFLHRRTVAPRRDSAAAISQWEKALEAKSSSMFDELDMSMKLYVGPEEGLDGARGYEGKTKQLADQARRDMGAMTMIWTSASGVLDQVKASLVYKGFKGFFQRFFDFFWPSRFRAAMKKLTVDPVVDIEAVVEGKKRSWKKDLYGDAQSYDEELGKKSFEQLMAEFNVRALRLVGDEEKPEQPGLVDQIKKALNDAGPTIERLEGLMKSGREKKSAVEAAGKADDLFTLPSLMQLLMAAAVSLEAARKRVVKDPVGALDADEGPATDAARKVGDAVLLVDAVLAARSGPLKAVAEGIAALEKTGIQTAWISKSVKKLSDQADALAEKGVAGALTDGIAGWKKDVGALADKVARAVELEKSRQTEALPAIAKIEKDVAAARARLGDALELDPKAMLREDKVDPSNFLADALAKTEAAKGLLDEGKLDEAGKALDEAEALAARAERIRAASIASLESHAASVKERGGKTDEIAGSITAKHGYAEALAEIKAKFDKSVLLLGSGDASHPNANGTIDDNIDEADAHLVESRGKLVKAVKVFKEGKVLEASDLLAQIAAHQEMSQHRLNEITDKEARLNDALAANARALGAMEQRLVDYKTSIEGDKRVMKPTLEALAKAAQKVRAARASVEAEKQNPFDVAAELAAAKAGLDKVSDDLARNDRDIYAEADRSVKAAESAIDAARRVANEAKSDNIADSAAIKASYVRIDELAGSLVRAKDWLGKSHDDWFALDHEADWIAAEAAKAAAALRGEMAAAEKAAAAIANAAKEVRTAGSWSGGYGVVITGSPGSGQLSEARSALERGDYPGASSAADRSRRTALDAVSEAEAEVSRRHAAEMRRQEEERRRREEERREREAAEEARRRRAREDEERSRSSWGGSSSSGSSGGSWGGSSSSGSSGGSWGGGSSSGSAGGGW